MYGALKHKFKSFNFFLFPVFIQLIQYIEFQIYNFPLYDLQVHKFGSIQFGEGPSGRCHSLPCNRTGTEGRMAEAYIFGTLDHYTSQSTEGRVYYRQTTTDTDLLTKLSDDINAFGCDGSFQASYAIVATWYKVRPWYYYSLCSFREDPLCVRKKRIPPPRKKVKSTNQ